MVIRFEAALLRVFIYFLFFYFKTCNMYMMNGLDSYNVHKRGRFVRTYVQDHPNSPNFGIFQVRPCVVRFVLCGCYSGVGCSPGLSVC